MHIIDSKDPTKPQYLSGRKKSDCTKTLGVFWGGEWGYLSMNIVPRINAICQANASLYITIGGFADDYIYFRDSIGNWTIDEYIGYDFWPVNRCQHTIKGPLTYDAAEALRYLHKNCDEVWETHKWSTEQFEDEFDRKKQVAYVFKTLVTNEPKIGDGKHIVIFPRAKNYTLCRLRSWNRPCWEEFFKLVLEQESPDTKIYICGVEKESVLFDWDDRIIPILSGKDRSAKTLNLLSNAMYCVSDCSGSAHYALQVGTPTFISGTPDYRGRFINERNYFGTCLYYQDATMSNLTAKQRFEGWKKFKEILHYNLKRDIYIYGENND